MNVLVDTQCWLWMQAAPERLPARARDVLADANQQLFLSAASIWEMAIKTGLGKLKLPLPLDEYVHTRLDQSHTNVLPIDHYHALRVGGLPPHHRDPFDRMLVAQAQVERWPIVTADPQLAAYDVEVIGPE
jgi:PIN domain nuclease of toxin-antitoxin system